MYVASLLPFYVRYIGWLPLFLLVGSLSFAQSDNVALDSMGANINRKNWKEAIKWAVKDGEDHPADKYWRYLNAAEFASLDKDTSLALHYTSLVAASDIATNAYFNANFDWLRDDPRWKALMTQIDQAIAQQKQERIQASLPFRKEQKRLLTQADQERAIIANGLSAEQLYQRLRKARPLRTYSSTERYQYAWLPYKDSLEVPYMIQLPANFDPQKDYPLVVVLHGAVSQQSSFPDVADSTTTTGFFGASFVEQARRSDIIAVFPYGTRHYNWMQPDAGFDLVPKVIRQVKQMYPIADNRVYITGHSNGATGAFSYLMKEPSLFAGFSGINNRPQVRTGGTFLRNGGNRSFNNVATDYDYYFPLEGHRSVTALANQLGIDWSNQEVIGKRDHSYLMFSQDSSVKSVYQQLFAKMLAKQRNPFANQLYWECDDVQHGRCDWLEIAGLDTLSTKANWHQSTNVSVQGWRSVEDPSVLLDSSSRAFVFPRCSGAVQASYSNNVFRLTTSQVNSIRLYLSPQMVDFKRPIQVIVNDKTVYSGLVHLDKEYLLTTYQREGDRQAVWANNLVIQVK